MIFHASESSDPSSQVYYEYNVELLQSIVNILLGVNEGWLKVKQIISLGKRTDGKLQPTILTFTEEIDIISSVEWKA